MTATDGPSDLELLEAWRQGDAPRGNQLFQRHFGTVHRYFANKVGGERDIEDLIQKTFLACVEGIDGFAGKAGFRTWLLGIAHNLLCDYYRRSAVRGSPLDLSEISVRELCPGPSTLLRDRREQQALLDALRAIPIDAQVVLELYYWERMTGPELAETLGLPENTVRSRIRNAKRKLLDALQKQHGRSVDGEAELDAWAAEVRAVAFADT